MDLAENELFPKLRSDLAICEHERKVISEKLDCLIELLRRAWHGKRDAIHKLSEIISLPAPKIIPCEEQISENERLSHEYLQVTSSLLDDQLEEDCKVKRRTKGLQSSSAKKMKSPARIHSASNATQQSRRSQHVQPFQEVRNDFSSRHEPTKTKAQRNGRNLSMNIGSISSPSTYSKFPNSERSNFGRVNVSQSTRPLSAALQRRQDYLRFQNNRKYQRPQSAKPAFKFNELESPNDFQSPSQDDNVCVQSRTSMLNDDESQHSISVDIYTKSTGRDIINIKRNIFPEERDAESFGDVAEALRRVQQMQTIFRRNTRRLQLKIGIPEAGCI